MFFKLLIFVAFNTEFKNFLNINATVNQKQIQNRSVAPITIHFFSIIEKSLESKKVKTMKTTIFIKTLEEERYYLIPAYKVS